MERKLKPIKVQEVLKEKKIHLFSPEEFRRIFSASLRAAQEFIKDHQEDLFIKLRNGLYTLRGNPPNELEIANRIYRPSYVSLEYALAHYGIIPEAVYSVTSVTTRTTREFLVSGKSYEYHHLKTQAYRGYQSEKRGEITILIAKPEKALVDYLYFVDLKLKSLNERLNLRRIHKETIFEYISLFQRKSLAKLVKNLL